MPVITTVAAKEDFIVQMNGDYNVPFDEVEVDAAVVSGEVIAVGAGFGIAAEAAEAGDFIRVMVRGNPTTVNAQALVGYVAATHDAAFADAGIVVVNK